MHPILAHPSRVAAYVAIWVLLGSLLTALLALQGVFSWPAAAAVALPLSVGYGFLCLSAYYTPYGAAASRPDVPRMLATAVIAGFVSSAIWVLAARGWMAVLASSTRWSTLPASFRAAAPTLFGFDFLLYLLAVAVSVLGTTFAAAREAERRGLELEVLAREAELRALRAQLDPHFLFNSLQSISALTTADPAAARRMCILLADFFRDTVALGARRRIPLARELALAERFLAIEQVRFGARLQVRIEPDEAGECLVPPLILQPLVENAVTHGIAHVLEGGTVQVEARRGTATLTLLIENPADRGRPAGRGTGLGLANVRDRLRTAYGSLEARVDAEDRGDRFQVRLELPLEVS